MVKQRQSNMELLRIVSILFIIIYHLLMFSIEPIGEPIYKALQIPLHIGVPCFVMISGYFGIRFSFKGLFRLLGTAYTYSLILEIIDFIVNKHSLYDVFLGMKIIGDNKLWFLTTYLWLYLLSPMINRFLSDITKNQRIYLFICLAFINFYAGHLMQHEPSLIEGKNILNFLMLYLVGNTVRLYQNKINNIKLWIFPSLFILSVSITTIIGLVLPSYQLPFVGNLWYKFFSYDSIGIYLNATLVFLLFSKMSFQSHIVNYVSSSVFSMYLLCFNFVAGILYNIPLQYPHFFNHNIALTLTMTLLLALGYMTFCVTIDKCLTPIWHIYVKLGDKLDNKIKIL